MRLLPVDLKKEAKTVLIEFGENTTAHGVPRVTKARTFRGYVFWICVCILCIILFLFQAVFLVQRYFRYETTTQIEVRFLKNHWSLLNKPTGKGLPQ